MTKETVKEQAALCGINIVSDPFITVKLRKSEVEELKSNYEYYKHINGASTEEGKYCTKIINRFKKALNGR